MAPTARVVFNHGGACTVAYDNHSFTLPISPATAKLLRAEYQGAAKKAKQVPNVAHAKRWLHTKSEFKLAAPERVLRLALLCVREGVVIS